MSEERGRHEELDVANVQIIPSVSVMLPQVNSLLHEIPGFPGYKATMAGKIYGLRGILLGTKDPYGSTYVTLIGRDKKRYRKNKAHLILAAFGRPKKRGQFVCFKDGNRSNFRIENLCWKRHKTSTSSYKLEQLIRKIVKEELK